MATNESMKNTNKCGDARGLHPNSLKNLKPNLNGRPSKDVSLTSLVKSLIDTVPPGETKGRTWRQLLALAWLSGAMKNPVLMKELLDRLEGKVMLPVGGQGDGGAIILKVVYDDGGKGTGIHN